MNSLNRIFLGLGRSPKSLRKRSLRKIIRINWRPKINYLLQLLLIKQSSQSHIRVNICITEDDKISLNGHCSKDISSFNSKFC